MGHLDDVKKLASVLQPFSEEIEGNAAVALLLKIVDRDLRVLLVKRIENPADRWSGQIALPGGRPDEADRNLEQTVVRETLEETRINLLDRCRFLGTLTPVESTRRPKVKILPFVVLLEHEPVIRLNEKELEWFVWISLKELVEHKGTVKLSLGEFPAYIVGNTVIWGLTYRILEKFIQTIDLHHNS
ncbi:MAG: CoA pyrophosphatase [Candidatus Bathyarchaeia archaeon]